MLCSAIAVDVRNTLIVFEIGINSPPFMGRSHKDAPVLVSLYFFLRWSTTERNYSVVPREGLVIIVPIHRVKTITEMHRELQP